MATTTITITLSDAETQRAVVEYLARRHPPVTLKEFACFSIRGSVQVSASLTQEPDK